MADNEERNSGAPEGQEQRPYRSSGEGRERRDSGERREGGWRGGRGWQDRGRRSRICQFCADKTKEIDYKDTMLLRQFVSDRGRITSRRKTSTCAKHQRILARAIKRARFMALLPYSPEHVRF